MSSFTSDADRNRCSTLCCTVNAAGLPVVDGHPGGDPGRQRRRPARWSGRRWAVGGRARRSGRRTGPPPARPRRRELRCGAVRRRLHSPPESSRAGRRPSRSGSLPPPFNEAVTLWSRIRPFPSRDARFREDWPGRSATHGGTEMDRRGFLGVAAAVAGAGRQAVVAAPGAASAAVTRPAGGAMGGAGRFRARRVPAVAGARNWPSTATAWSSPTPPGTAGCRRGLNDLVDFAAAVLSNPANGVKRPGSPVVADVPTTKFTARRGGRTWSISAEGLGVLRDQRAYPRPLYELLDEFTERRDQTLRGGRPFTPDAVRLVTRAGRAAAGHAGAAVAGGRPGPGPAAGPRLPLGGPVRPGRPRGGPRHPAPGRLVVHHLPRHRTASTWPPAGAASSPTSRSRRRSERDREPQVGVDPGGDGLRPGSPGERLDRPGRPDRGRPWTGRPPRSAAGRRTSGQVVEARGGRPRPAPTPPRRRARSIRPPRRTSPRASATAGSSTARSGTTTRSSTATASGSTTTAPAWRRSVPLTNRGRPYSPLSARASASSPPGAVDRYVEETRPVWPDSSAITASSRWAPGA